MTKPERLASGDPEVGPLDKTHAAQAALTAAPQLAAGALVWRVVKDQLEVLLVHRPRYNDWSWPKGKLEPGETLLTCAWREVLEETGRQVVLGRPLPPVVYPLKSGRMKQVRYWAARLAMDDDVPSVWPRPPVTMASPREIDQSEWLEAGRALRRLTNPSDRLPLVKLMRFFQKGTLDTRVLVLLRHTEAMARTAWSKADASRPLTGAGRRAARGLVPSLAALGVRQIVTSPWARCRATVRPYARRSRLPINTNRWLSETDAVHRPGRAGRLIDRVLGGEVAAVVCSHRPVLPLLTARLLAGGGGKLAKQLGPGALELGEMAVAHVVATGHRRGRVIAIDRHLPT
ncbi:MAG: NUDIX hydrolase [Micrococcales bacterium]|nr:NUDIX hydrolase [Micrococcales bacterium]